MEIGTGVHVSLNIVVTFLVKDFTKWLSAQCLIVNAQCLVTSYQSEPGLTERVYSFPRFAIGENWSNELKIRWMILQLTHGVMKSRLPGPTFEEAEKEVWGKWRTYLEQPPPAPVGLVSDCATGAEWLTAMDSLLGWARLEDSPCLTLRLGNIHRWEGGGK